MVPAAAVPLQAATAAAASLQSLGLGLAHDMPAAGKRGPGRPRGSVLVQELLREAAPARPPYNRREQLAAARARKAALQQARVASRAAPADAEDERRPEVGPALQAVLHGHRVTARGFAAQHGCAPDSLRRAKIICASLLMESEENALLGLLRSVEADVDAGRARGRWAKHQEGRKIAQPSLTRLPCPPRNRDNNLK
jgi:hypothetical protein